MSEAEGDAAGARRGRSLIAGGDCARKGFELKDAP